MNNTGPSRWWRYVTEVAGGDSQAKLARRTGLSPATVSRWQGADPRPHNVAVFAAAYGRPVLEAFVAAGFLTEQQARAQVVRADPTVLTDDELLAEVRARMGRGQVVDVDVDEVDPDVVSLRAAGLTDEAIAEALRGRDPGTGSSAGAPEFHPRRRAQ
jgi:transcriptional regulator with XRE-family HTH domain